MSFIVFLSSITGNKTNYANYDGSADEEIPYEQKLSLAEALENNTKIDCLSITNYRFENDDSTTRFAEALQKNKTIEILYLRKILIDAAALNRLMEALSKNKSIKYLTIEFQSEMTPVPFLEEILRDNKELVKLGISLFGDDLTKLIKYLGSNRTLKTLDLKNGGELRQDDVVALADTLQTNDTLLHLQLKHGLTKDQVEILKGSVKNNKNIISLEIGRSQDIAKVNYFDAEVAAQTLISQHREKKPISLKIWQSFLPRVSAVYYMIEENLDSNAVDKYKFGHKDVIKSIESQLEEIFLRATEDTPLPPELNLRIAKYFGNISTNTKVLEMILSVIKTEETTNIFANHLNNKRLPNGNWSQYSDNLIIISLVKFLAQDSEEVKVAKKLEFLHIVDDKPDAKGARSEGIQSLGRERYENIMENVAQYFAEELENPTIAEEIRKIAKEKSALYFPPEAEFNPQEAGALAAKDLGHKLVGN